MGPIQQNFKLPPPPPIFVGRHEELRALGKEAQEHQVLCVHGAGGSGKSALVRRWLEARPDPCFCVEVRPGDSLRDTLALLTYALGVRALDKASVNEYLAAAVDRADSLGAVCVIEDLHHLSDERVTEFIELLERQAKRSQWVLTTRRPLVVNGAVPLGAMNPEDAHILAGRLGTQLPTDESLWTPMAVLRANARQDSQAQTPDSMLLRHLSLVDLALSLEDMARLGPLPSDELVEQLGRSGLLVRTSDGYRLHDVVRQTISASLEMSERQELLTTQGEQLQSSDRPQTTLEALRARLATGMTASAEELVAERGSDLIEAGYGARLWRLLAKSETPGLKYEAFRVAVTVATPEAMNWLQTQPAPTEPRTKLRWLEGLVIAGRREEARKGAEEFLETEGLAPEFRTEASLLLVSIYLRTGALQRAGKLLDSVDPAKENHRWRAVSLRAIASMAGGNLTAALKDARMARDACSQLAMEDARSIRAEVEPILLELGEVDDSDGDFEKISTASNRQIQVVRAMALTAQADPAAAKKLLTVLTQRGGSNPTERSQVQLAAAGIGLATGDLEAMTRHLGVALECAREAQDWNAYQWAMTAHATFGLIVDTPEPVLPWDGAFEPPGGVHAAQLDAVNHLLALDRAFDSPTTTEALRSVDAMGETAVVLGVTQAVASLLEGDLHAALVISERTVAKASAGGWKAWEILARAVTSAVNLVRRERTALSVASDRFYQQALGSGLPMARRTAEFFCEAAQVNPKLSIIEAIAADAATAPRSAGWARSLFGIAEPRGVLAKIVVNATKNMWGDLQIVHIPGDSPKTLGWGVDIANDELWLPEEPGNTIGLGRRSHFKEFVRFLASAGGRASMEELAVNVWDVAEYHPVRDENRIRVAVRRYRDLLRDDRNDPKRLITIPGGYAFGSEDSATIAWRQ